MCKVLVLFVLHLMGQDTRRGCHINVSYFFHLIDPNIIFEWNYIQVTDWTLLNVLYLIIPKLCTITGVISFLLTLLTKLNVIVICISNGYLKMYLGSHLACNVCTCWYMDTIQRTKQVHVIIPRYEFVLNHNDALNRIRNMPVWKN